MEGMGWQNLTAGDRTAYQFAPIIAEPNRCYCDTRASMLSPFRQNFHIFGKIHLQELTLMVNLSHQNHNPFFAVRSDLPWPPPSDQQGAEATRDIPFRVWVLDEIRAIAAKQLADVPSDVIVAVTNDCAEDMQRDGLTFEFLAQMILDIDEDEDYDKSFWCMKSHRKGVRVHPDALWLPCDAYIMPTTEEMPNGTVVQKRYYLKMCKSLAGTLLLMVSVHPSVYS